MIVIRIVFSQLLRLFELSSNHCDCYQKLCLNTARKEVKGKQKLILIPFLSPTFRRLVASYTTKIIFYKCYLPQTYQNPSHDTHSILLCVHNLALVPRKVHEIVSHTLQG